MTVAVDVSGNGPGAILRYDAGGRLLWRKDVAAGVKALAVGGDMVWAAEYAAPTVMRIDRRTCRLHDKNVASTDILQYLKVELAIRKARGVRAAKLNSKILADLFSQ